MNGGDGENAVSSASKHHAHDNVGIVSKSRSNVGEISPFRRPAALAASYAKPQIIRWRDAMCVHRAMAASKRAAGMRRIIVTAGHYKMAARAKRLQKQRRVGAPVS